MANTVTIIKRGATDTLKLVSENIYLIGIKGIDETNILYNITNKGSATSVELKFKVKFYKIDELFYLQERSTTLQNVSYPLQLTEIDVDKTALIAHPATAEILYIQIVADSDISIELGAFSNQ